MGQDLAVACPSQPSLAQAREVITVDPPGHGRTLEESDSGTFDGLARSLDNWLSAKGLTGMTWSAALWALA